MERKKCWSQSFYEYLTALRTPALTKAFPSQTFPRPHPPSDPVWEAHPPQRGRSRVQPCCTAQAGWFLCLPLCQSSLHPRLLLLRLSTRNSSSHCPHSRMILVTSNAHIHDEQGFMLLPHELPSKLLAAAGAGSTFLQQSREFWLL